MRNGKKKKVKMKNNRIKRLRFKDGMEIFE